MLEFNPYFDISFLLFFLFIYFSIDIYLFRRTPRFFLLPSFDIVDDKNNFVEITLLTVLCFVSRVNDRIE